jgi:hypothetical protein
MAIEYVVTVISSYNLFSVMVRALNVEAVVMGLNPGMNQEQSGSELWTMGCCCVFFHFLTFFSISC